MLLVVLSWFHVVTCSFLGPVTSPTYALSTSRHLPLQLSDVSASVPAMAVPGKPSKDGRSSGSEAAAPSPPPAAVRQPDDEHVAASSGLRSTRVRDTQTASLPALLRLAALSGAAYAGWRLWKRFFPEGQDGEEQEQHAQRAKRASGRRAGQAGAVQPGAAQQDLGPGTSAPYADLCMAHCRKARPPPACRPCVEAQPPAQEGEADRKSVV